MRDSHSKHRLNVIFKLSLSLDVKFEFVDILRSNGSLSLSLSLSLRTFDLALIIVNKSYCKLSSSF